MSKLRVSKIFKTVSGTLSKHSPGILTGFGIAGMISTAVLAVKATPKALELIEKEKKRQNRELRRKAEESGSEETCIISRLKFADLVKTAWKCYIPAVVTGSISAACLIGANSVNAKRNAVLATAYRLSETAFSEYKEKVIETIGEKKEHVIRDEIAKDRIEKNPVTTSEVVITEKGNTLCYDSICGRYFRSDIEKIKQIINELNRRLLSEMYISLNDLYYELGLSSTEMGDDLGWNSDEGMIEVDFSSALANDGTPCLVIGYNYAPRFDYRNLY